VYDRPFQLTYVVTLAQHQLSTDLHVANPSESATLQFQSLLHTYIAAPAQELTITPLQNVKYYDKMESITEAQQTAKVETRAKVDVRRPTDSVYEDAPLDYTVSWPGGTVNIRAREFKDVVVWNPGEGGKKIADMEDGGWSVLSPFSMQSNFIFNALTGTTMSVSSPAMLEAMLTSPLAKHGSDSRLLP
jgi:glucose-6-phosphate 1-epimerase